MQAIPPGATLTERILRQSRWLTLAALVIVIILAWLYILSGAGTGMSTLAMTTWDLPTSKTLRPMQMPWNLDYALIMLLMWWVMMIAMMLPSAAPMILLYARVVRKNSTAADGAGQAPMVASANFAGGYLSVWLLFSVTAVLLQWWLERLGLVHSMMMWSTSATLSGALLLGAGLYQFSSLKTVCLRHCQSPVQFMANHWQPGKLGAFRMGVRHGVYCTGCCWALMTLLFVGGAMNLVWIVGLGLLVLVEKLLSRGRAFVYLSGLVLCVSGVLLLVNGVT
ncbi:MAG: DUF2182 domain-containing protein [Gammaproteobacteria bacterium]|nr:DUF2182 domain-containing protein [Gammaproteobacteria bacterium]